MFMSHVYIVRFDMRSHWTLTFCHLKGERPWAARRFESEDRPPSSGHTPGRIRHQSHSLSCHTDVRSHPHREDSEKHFGLSSDVRLREFGPMALLSAYAGAGPGSRATPPCSRPGGTPEKARRATFSEQNSLEDTIKYPELPCTAKSGTAKSDTANMLKLL